MLSLFAMALLFMLLGVVLFSATRASVITTRDLAWLSTKARLPAEEADVYRRYLARHRRHRVAGGLFGVAFACVAGVRWNNSVSLGVGNGPPWADVLWCGLAGVILGALSAESFRLSEPRSAVHLASLTARPELARTDLVRWARLFCGVGLALGVFDALDGSTDSTALGVAVGGTCLLALAEVTRGAVRRRRRPVMSDRAAVVDLRLREFASRSVAHLAFASGCLTLAWTVSKTAALDFGVLVQPVLVLALFITAVVHLLRAAPRPPRRWNPVPA